MKVPYDKYYQTKHLFGNPSKVLIDFFAKYPKRGKLLDIGCGQGRDAIPLARLGYQVVGIDLSKVGIEQMNQVAQSENLPLKGVVADIFEFPAFEEFEFVLLDSMFHFTKKDRRKETEYIERIFAEISSGCLVIFCLQDTGKKVEILNNIIDGATQIELLTSNRFVYVFEDPKSKHRSTTNYQMLIVKKNGK